MQEHLREGHLSNVPPTVSV